MKTQVLMFHHDFQHSKVNKILFEQAQLLKNVKARNIYAEYTNFKINVEQEHRYLDRSDRIVLQFPMTWYSCPALLKQWEDSVFTAGYAFGNVHKLKNKELLIAVTVGAHEENYLHQNNHYTVKDLLQPFQALAQYLQMRYLQPFIVCGASHLTDKQLQDKQFEYKRILLNNEIKEEPIIFS